MVNGFASAFVSARYALAFVFRWCFPVNDRAYCGLSKDGTAWTETVDETFSSTHTKRRKVQSTKHFPQRTVCGSKARSICVESLTAPDKRTPQPRAEQPQHYRG